MVIHGYYRLRNTVQLVASRSLSLLLEVTSLRELTGGEARNGVSKRQIPTVGGSVPGHFQHAGWAWSWHCVWIQRRHAPQSSQGLTTFLPPSPSLSLFLPRSLPPPLSLSLFLPLLWICIHRDLDQVLNIWYMHVSTENVGPKNRVKWQHFTRNTA